MFDIVGVIGKETKEDIIEELFNQVYMVKYEFLRDNTSQLEEAKKAPNMLVQDLLRLALFSKDTIDTKRLSSCKSFQAVGKPFLQPHEVKEIH